MTKLKRKLLQQTAGGKMSDLTIDLQPLPKHGELPKDTPGVRLGVQSGVRRIGFEGAASAATADQPLFFASITNVLAATVLMLLRLRS